MMKSADDHLSFCSLWPKLLAVGTTHHGILESRVVHRGSQQEAIEATLLCWTLLTSLGLPLQEYCSLPYSTSNFAK